MISDIPFYKVRFRGWDALMPLSLGLGSIIVLVVYGDLAFATLAFSFTYMLLNLMAGVAREMRERYQAIVARSVAK